MNTIKELRKPGVTEAPAAMRIEAVPVNGHGAGGADSASPPPESSQKQGARKWVGITVAGLVAVSLVILGARTWVFGMSHVTTDNAQVEGHIIPVLAKVSGYVSAVKVDDNQQVKAGDLLVLVDDRDFAVRLKQTEADLAVALANSGGGGRPGQAGAELAEARATVTQAEATAWRTTRDLERYRTLADRDVIGRQQLDSAEAAAREADAQLQAAREHVAAGQAALHGADARVAAAAAARDQAAVQLSYTRIAAPASGVVSKKSVEVGQLVQAGQPLMSVVMLDDPWLVANLKETEIKDVTPGDRVAIEADSYPGRRFPGRVESLSPATGAKFSLLPPDNATGNFTKVVQRVPVKIRLVGPPDPAHPLRPGTSVKVVIATR